MDVEIGLDILPLFVASRPVLRRLCERAGVDAINPHRFRHTFAVSVIQSDVPLPTLEVMGGCRRVPSTYLATLGDREALARPPQGFTGGPDRQKAVIGVQTGRPGR